MMCSIETCGKKMLARGWCQMHYGRWWKHGDPLFVSDRNGAVNPNWRGDDISYDGAHRRVKRLHGSASKHACVDCGQRAADWAYVSGCPNEKEELTKNGPRRYSPDPRRYQPMCRPCHRKFDGITFSDAARLARHQERKTA